MKVPISILVPIKNEAANLLRCLQSVAWADEIIVVDSQSVDGSPALAEGHGARVVQFYFNGTWPKKRNWALENVQFKHEWLFILDADEVLPPQAEEELGRIVSAPEGRFDGYWINRRFMFMGKWLKHSYYPNWNLRLFKHRLGRYEKLTDVDTASGDNEVHEHVIVQGRTSRLDCQMDHYAFPSVEVFVEKHNRYSNWEAQVATASVLPGTENKIQSQAVSRRRKLKRLSHRLPCRPLLRFLYIFIWQRGFLDGIEGYYFARLHAFYEFLSVAKTFELKKVRGCKAGSPSEQTEITTKCGVWITPLFLLCLGAVLFYTLRPSSHGARVSWLPLSMAHWISGHDGWSNILAFAALAAFGFFAELPSPLSPTKSLFSKLSAALANRWRRLAIFLTLVLSLEIAQLGIRGRVCDVRDMVAGLAGVLAAWFVWKFWRARRRLRTSLSSPPETNQESSAVIKSTPALSERA